MSARGPDAPAAAVPAGFWRRLAAWLIDGAIVLEGFFLVGVYLWPDLVLTTTLTSEVDGARLETVRYAPTPLGAVVLGIAVWAYAAFQECGPRQATLGKRALGLRVCGFSTPCPVSEVSQSLGVAGVLVSTVEIRVSYCPMYHNTWIVSWSNSCA